MKKTLIIVAFATFIFTSCKKDYNCSCDTTVTVDYTSIGGAKTTTTQNTKYVFNATKSNATTSCDLLDVATETSGLVTSGVSCSIE
jgi:hypothetical protein